MCWVMPPASPATTRVLRMWSSSEVLPWSTWPITVTTGGRGRCSPSTCSERSRCFSTSSSATSFTRWPNSSTTRVAVSWSKAWLMVAITPMSMSFLMTSPAFTLMPWASSPTVAISPTSTSRTMTSCGFSNSPPCFSTERARRFACLAVCLRESSRRRLRAALKSSPRVRSRWRTPARPGARRLPLCAARAAACALAVASAAARGTVAARSRSRFSPRPGLGRRESRSPKAGVRRPSVRAAPAAPDAAIRGARSGGRCVVGAGWRGGSGAAAGASAGPSRTSGAGRGGGLGGSTTGVGAAFATVSVAVVSTGVVSATGAATVSTGSGVAGSGSGAGAGSTVLASIGGVGAAWRGSGWAAAPRMPSTFLRRVTTVTAPPRPPLPARSVPTSRWRSAIRVCGSAFRSPL